MTLKETKRLNFQKEAEIGTRLKKQNQNKRLKDLNIDWMMKTAPCFF